MEDNLQAEALRAQYDAGALAAAARFDAEAMVGHGVEEARAYYLGHGFPVVMVEQEGGSSVLSLMRQRVRLVVNTDGIVVEAHLG
jgi:hypothetical protein